MKFTALIILLLAGCSLESPPQTSTIRAHDEVYQGVFHGAVASKALRYCIKCHGSSLQGGDGGEPSCLQCHGQTWLSTITANQAPASHTDQKGLWMHHPSHSSDTSTCTLCHGEELEGSQNLGTPSCTICHPSYW